MVASYMIIDDYMIKQDNKILATQYNLQLITYLIISHKMQQSRTMGQQTGSAKTHLDTVEDLCRQTLQFHQTFSTKVQTLSSTLSILRQKVKQNPVEIRKYFVQKLRPVEDDLIGTEENQKQENKINQEAMTQIKRENKQTVENVVKTFQKLKVLEEKIGVYQGQ